MRAHLPPGQVDAVVRALHEQELTEEASRALGRPAISHDDDDVFIYTDTAESAEQARLALTRALADVGAEAHPSVSRWHHLEERWEDASAPMPETEAQREVEHERLIEEEDEESAADGSPDWEVRVTLPSHRDAREFAERLEAEGIPVLSLAVDNVDRRTWDEDALRQAVSAFIEDRVLPVARRRNDGH